MTKSPIDRTLLLLAILWSTRVVIGGGGLFDDRVADFYRPYARIAMVTSILRKKYDIVAVGVGPIRNEPTKKAYRRVFTKANKVSVRDKESAQRLKHIGITAAVEVVDDPALWNPRRERITDTKFDLTINLRNWVYNAIGTTNSSQTVAEMCNAIAAAVNANDSIHRVALVSMSTQSGDDDAVAMDNLGRRLRCAVTTVSKPTVETVEEVVRRSRAVLTMRLHLALISVCNQVPVTAIEYDSKIHQQGQRHGFSSIPLDDPYFEKTVSSAISRLLRETADTNETTTADQEIANSPTINGTGE